MHGWYVRPGAKAGLPEKPCRASPGTVVEADSLGTESRRWRSILLWKNVIVSLIRIRVDSLGRPLRRLWAGSPSVMSRELRRNRAEDGTFYGGVMPRRKAATVGTSISPKSINVAAALWRVCPAIRVLESTSPPEWFGLEPLHAAVANIPATSSMEDLSSFRQWILTAVRATARQSVNCSGVSDRSTLNRAA
jgi:hypothetical protein